MALWKRTWVAGGPAGTTMLPPGGEPGSGWPGPSICAGAVWDLALAKSATGDDAPGELNRALV